MKKNILINILNFFGLYRKTYRYFQIYNSLNYIDETIEDMIHILSSKDGFGLVNITALYSDVNEYKRYCRYLKRLISSYYDRGKIKHSHYIITSDKYKLVRIKINLYKKFIDKLDLELSGNVK